MENFLKNSSIIILMFILFTGILYSQEENIDFTISDIDIKGLDNISFEKVKNSMATEFPSFKPWVDDPVFDERVLKDDVLRIRDLLGNNGYYNSTVDYNLEYNAGKKSVEILIEIDEGNPVILIDLNIQLPEGYKGGLEKKIADRLPIKVGEVFSVNKYESSKNIINQTLANEGYPKSDVKGEATISRRENVAKAVFNVDPGNFYTFGEYELIGVGDINPELITREITFKEGDKFTLSEITKTQENIFKLSFFKSVVIDTVFDDENHKVEILFTLKERKLRTVRLGVGAGTEDIIRGQVSYNQRNFLGGARSLEISTKASFITQNLQLVLKQPYFFSRENELRGSVSLERNDLPSFESESVDSEIRLSRDIFSFLSSYVASSIVFAKIDSVADTTPILSSQEDVTLALFSGGLQYNTTDNFIDPTKGVFASAFIETSFDALISDESYFKSLFEFRTYRKVNRFVFAKRLQIGFIEPFDSTGEFEVPVFKRFFAGGSTSMRGFPFQRLGPLDEDEDPLGGNSILVGNIEARFPLYRKVGGVLFLDYGNVFSSSLNYDFDDIRYAVGAGLRYNTIVGPIRVDLGYALNPVDELSRVQLFISIGQAF